jgi:WD40 repeat protein
MVKTILVLASNPKGTQPLDLNKEVREIREGLMRSKNRDEFFLEWRGAVRPEDLRYALSEVKPQILHFCGHGTGQQGLVLEDDEGQEHLVGTDVLQRLFKIFSDHLECILLNACYSEEQADAIVQHINYVIGMDREVRDDAAIAFAVDFYRGLGNGLSIEQAFELGKVAVSMEIESPSTHFRKLAPIQSPDDAPQPLLDHLIPVLKKKPEPTTVTPPTDSAPTQTTTSEQDSLIGHADWIRSIAFSSDGKTLLSGSNDKTARLWDVQTGQLLHLLTGHRERIKCVGMSPDGELLLSSSVDSVVKTWSRSQLSARKTGDCHYTIKASSKPMTLGYALPVSPNPDRPYFATGAEHGRVALWHLETGEAIRSIQAHTSAVTALTFSPDGRFLVSGSNNSTIKLWDLESAAEQPVFVINHAHLSQVLSIAISSQTQTIVSSGADRTIKLWNLRNGEKESPHILKGHAGQVYCIGMSPDGSTIASASADFTVKLWDIQSGKLLQTLIGHLGEVRSVVFSPDGSLIASGGDDLEIKLWRNPITSS